jgi:abhydrolase domain-containing protein 1/3
VIANAIRSRVPDVPADRQLIMLQDGGQVSLDWYKEVDEQQKENTFPADEKKEEVSEKLIIKRKAIAIIVPGLTGCSQTEYVKTLVPCLQAAGYQCAGFNQRSRGGTKLLTPRLYCAANCGDLSYTFSLVREKNPDAVIVAIGISLGGIQLTRYLVDAGSESKIDGAVIMSVVFDLLKANEGLEKFGMNRFFNHMLTKGLIQIMEEERGMLSKAENIDLDQVRKSKTLRQLDGRFTAKMFGYNSAEDYYIAASNKDKLHQIKVPTLFLSSADDFMTPKEILPIEEIRETDHCAMILTSSGGHIGFMSGFFPKLPFFSEQIVSEYLRNFCESY